MKKLEELKMYNFKEICAEEQRSITGGLVEEEDIIDGGMIGEVEVYGRSGGLVSSKWGGLFSFFYYSGFSSGNNATVNGSDQAGNHSGGGTTDYGRSVLESLSITPDNQLAAIIEANRNVTLAKVHVSKIADGADANQNIEDIADGFEVCTSNYSDAKGVMVCLSHSLLCGIVTLAQCYRFSISEIAGGDHSAKSTHYQGNSMDVNMVNDRRVNTISMSTDEIITFRKAAIAAGATKVLDPLNEPKHHYNHFHIEW